MNYIITGTGNRTFCGLCQEGRFLQIDLCGGTRSEVGSIYVGRVQNVVKNIGAVFVEYQPGRIGYLSESECRKPFYTRKQSTSDLPGPGDELLVEVIRDAIKSKQPALSCTLTFQGALAVAAAGNPVLGISSRITAAGERARLKRLAEPYRTESLGLILRTASEQAPEEDVCREIESLRDQAQALLRRGQHLSAFSCLRNASTPYLGGLAPRDLEQLDEILTDLPEATAEIKEELASRGLQIPVRLWDEEVSLASVYRTEQALNRALQEKVWMNSGAYLVIEQTEACVVIDVNTGKAIHGKKDQEETFYKINLEAAAETARQIRLRNLSGIILVDFIDLSDSKAKTGLVEALRRHLGEDPVPTGFVDFTKLQLAEITRKKIRPSLKEQASGWIPGGES